MRNSIPMAVVGGLVTSILGAAVWAGITLATGYQIGWIAVGVGFLVGVGVRMLGQGETVTFGAIGAGFALFGCVLGNLFSGIGFIAGEEEISFFTALSNFDYTASFALLGAMFSAIDLLFYGIAGYEGFKFSIAGGTDAA